jgi:SAM-dependent methyltransferase
VTDAVVDGYDAVYRAWSSSPRFHHTWAHHAVDGQIAPGFEHLSFNTVDDLRRFVAELRLPRGGSLLDVACGAGGPGVWVARESNVPLVGIDVSRVGIALARQRAIDHRTGAGFAVASATSLPLNDACIAGAMSIDSLQYVPDKRAAFDEVARVLLPHARFVFTAFELDPERVTGLPVLGVDPVADYAPPLQASGFDVATYEGTPHWEQRLEAAYSAVIAAQDVLRPEMGDEAIDALLLELTLTLAVKPYRGRAFVVAVRR